MVKQRLIFTLLYHDGSFMLSRNFRLQRAGDIGWLKSNYNFKNITFAIDELIILDVSRGGRNRDRFCEHIKMIAEGCFIPVAAGGGITSFDHARTIMCSGADKLVVNSALFRTPSLVEELVSTYGSQCIIASVDVKREKDRLAVYIDNGMTKVEVSFPEYIRTIINIGIGEIYLNSIDKDGTGQRYLLDLLSQLDDRIAVPVIIAGGAGNWQHLLEGFRHDKVDAAATANLFNFIGQGFPNARKKLIDAGVNLAQWESINIVGKESEVGLTSAKPFLPPMANWVR
jgi:imidazole glycerol-phosphate synthase subunit HisF